MPVGGFAWWLGSDPAIADGIDTDIPVYMVQSSEEGPEHGILVIRGSVDDGLTYTIRRGDGVTLGEDEIINLTAEDDRLHRRRAGPGLAADDRVVDAPRRERHRVRRAARRPPTATSPRCSTPPTGLVQASAEERTTRAWQVDRPLDAARLEGPVSWLRIVLLVVQGVGVVVVAVLCLPTTNPRRSTP